MILNLDRFLESTELIDWENEFIKEKASELRAGASNAEEIAERIFYFIRDEIRYAFRVPRESGHFKASTILQTKMGFCTLKAILFCALARNCGIPAGIYFFDIVDYSLPEKFVQLLRTRTMYRHGVPTLLLNGAWRKLDATLDSQLVQKNGVMPVEFSADRDCLMSPKTKDGEKHIDYIVEYGLYADVSYNLIAHWFGLYYSHLM